MAEDDSISIAFITVKPSSSKHSSLLTHYSLNSSQIKAKKDSGENVDLKILTFQFLEVKQAIFLTRSDVFLLVGKDEDGGRKEGRLQIYGMFPRTF